MVENLRMKTLEHFLKSFEHFAKTMVLAITFLFQEHRSKTVLLRERIDLYRK